MATGHDCFAEHGQVVAAQVQEPFMASWAGQLVLGCLAQKLGWPGAAALWPVALWPAPWPLPWRSWQSLAKILAPLSWQSCHETMTPPLSVGWVDEEVAWGQLGLVQVASLDQQALDLLPLGVDRKLLGHHLGNGLLHWLIHGHGGCGNTSCWWASGKLWTQQGLQIQKHNFHNNWLWNVLMRITLACTMGQKQSTLCCIGFAYIALCAAMSIKCIKKII